MAKGIERKFDELGRITIPVEMRRSLGLMDRGMVDIYLDNGVICLKSNNTSIDSEPREFTNIKSLRSCTNREISTELLRRFS